MPPLCSCCHDRPVYEKGTLCDRCWWRWTFTKPRLWRDPWFLPGVLVMLFLSPVVWLIDRWPAKGKG